MNLKRSRVVKGIVAAGLTVALTSGIALASIGTGTVTASSLRLRSEATVQSATLAYAPYSSQVSILAEAADGWYKVSYDGLEGYMSADWLDVELTGAEADQEAAGLRQGTVTADVLNVRSGPGTGYGKVGSLQKGATVSITDESHAGWYGILSGSVKGYVSAEYIDLAPAPETEDPQPDASPEEPSEPETETRQGTVTADVLNVRSGAGTGYSKVGSLQKGATVTITGETNGWYAITSGSVKGYVSAEYIDLAPVGGSSNAPVVDETPGSDETEPQRGMVNTSALNVRSGPGTGYSKVALLSRGASVTITGETDGWYAITAGSIEGYVSAEYITILDGSNASDGSVGAAAAAMAKSLVGSPYVYGASGPYSFDCSGLLYYIYGQLGYPIARGSSSQYNQSGYFVSADEIQPGDLVFFFDPRYDSSGGTLPTTHAGIYVGNNQFVHASSSIYGVRYDSLFGGYWDSYIVGFKRIA